MIFIYILSFSDDADVELFLQVISEMDDSPLVIHILLRSHTSCRFLYVKQSIYNHLQTKKRCSIRLHISPKFEKTISHIMIG